ncbi:MAG: amidohydrolase [Gammaproteobacteria bacterium]|nr:amidohydrolase [Gammaproteobacteria bacterium]
MKPSRPEATHVAVQNGRIVDVGTLEEFTNFGKFELDTRLSDKVLMPGLVEGHSHVMQGAFWQQVYCGSFDRIDPDGVVWTGLHSNAHLLDRLRKVESSLNDPYAPLAGWGYDPLLFDADYLDRHDLDQISSVRPIGILHASCHILNVNTRVLELSGLLRTGLNHPGIPLDKYGLPTGELRGHEVMAAANRHVGFLREELARDEQGLRQFARQCIRSGVTTATDLAAILSDDAVEMMLRVTGEKDFPVRIVPAYKLLNITVPDLISRANELLEQSTDRLRLGAIKVVADGSIQGFTARLRTPRYFNGSPNGLWYLPPEQLKEVYRLALRQGVQVHTHTNGDQATELTLDCIDDAMRLHSVHDHRFTLQHCQLADAAQFRKMREFGVCVNLFSNHIYYWGDMHYKYTVGPERAERMNACATALACGVPTAIHSDAPITPLGPLFTAWCAINRQTSSGRVLGRNECISIDAALYAITLGAAYTLKLDGEIGSIECGKRADFAVLEDDPIQIGGERLKDVRIWGTVQDGRVFEAATA